MLSEYLVNGGTREVPTEKVRLAGSLRKHMSESNRQPYALTAFCPTLNRRAKAWQVLSSVAPGLEIHATMVRLLRSIFSHARDSETDSGFLRAMRSLTGALPCSAVPASAR